MNDNPFELKKKRNGHFVISVNLKDCKISNIHLKKHIIINLMQQFKKAFFWTVDFFIFSDSFLK